MGVVMAQVTVVIVYDDENDVLVFDVLTMLLLVGVYTVVLWI
jgi:hypothetical protein